MNLLYDAFPEFEFFKDDGSELVLVNPHTDLTYWSDLCLILIFIIS